MVADALEDVVDVCDELETPASLVKSSSSGTRRWLAGWPSPRPR